MRPDAEDIATVDSAQLIDPKQKKLSNSLRSIETKSATKKVSVYLCSPILLSFLFFRCYEENFPNA
jgi:hypothetical protein